MNGAAMRSLTIGARTYPVILPTLRDPRLHVAAVIVSIHVLGQVGLGFRVSVPQILAAIVTCAVIEVTVELRRTQRIVWPASAMLTGSGVALILRLVGTERGEHWSWDGWHLFALVAGLSLASKYLVRHRGTHVFNPSNLGLVVAFLVLGSGRVEPLDFWWAPLNVWMVLAYLVIVTGGLLITARLRLASMALVFWLVFTAAIGLLASSGHCFTAAWALGPVCGFEFWQVVVTSPEVLVFLFFMITDPMTVPASRPGRVAFAACVALLSTLFIAPWATEFGAKVGLLSALVVLTPFRRPFDRLAEQPGGIGLQLREWLDTTSPLPVFARGAALGSFLVLTGFAIVAAGAPARAGDPTADRTDPAPVDVAIDPSTLPSVTVGEEVTALHSDVVPEVVALALAEGLAVEREAMLRAAPSLLRTVDEGDRLVGMERAIRRAVAAGRLTAGNHEFDRLHLDVVFADGPQGGANLALVADGTIEEVTYDLDGIEVGREREPFRSTFVLRPGRDGGWLIVSERRS